MFLITRKYNFSAAHRLEGHPKCGRLHGHNYYVTVTLLANTVSDGMVIDYGEMDKVIKPIIDQFDHRYMVSRENRDAGDPYFLAARGERLDDIVDLPLDRSTAECLSEHFFVLIEHNRTFAERSITLVSVQVDETEKSTALFRL